MRYNKCTTVHKQIGVNQNHNRARGMSAIQFHIFMKLDFISIFRAFHKISYRHSNGCNDDGEDQPDDGRSLSRSASENSVAQHERNNNSTNNESINGYALM